MIEKDTVLVTVYVELLNEGSSMCRPTKAIDLGDGTYKILPTDDYDDADEEWAFLPGTVVRCVMLSDDRESYLQAYESI